MIKRILTAIMLIFTMLLQYAQLPVMNATVYLTKTAQNFTGTCSADISIVAIGSIESAPTPIPPDTTSSLPRPTPQGEYTDLAKPPEETEDISSSISPNSEPAPSHALEEASSPAPPPIEGPLVDKLPEFDPESSLAKAFKEQMSEMVKTAEKKSGIKTTYGVFIMDLYTELYYGVNENLTNIDEVDKVPEGAFNSASVVKLYQGYIFCDMIRRGELDSEKTYYDKVTGRRFKLLPMLKYMISYSDNNYSNACLRIVDNKQSNEVLTRLGIKNSRLYGEMSPAIGYSRKNNLKKYGTDKRCARLTPMDTGLILYNIYRNKYTDPYMKLLNEALLGNIYNSRIPAGVKRVSSRYFVAHKTGTNTGRGIYNDAGIIYTERPYILVVFTQDTTRPKGEEFIRSLAEQLTRHFGKSAP